MVLSCTNLSIQSSGYTSSLLQSVTLHSLSVKRSAFSTTSPTESHRMHLTGFLHWGSCCWGTPMHSVQTFPCWRATHGPELTSIFMSGGPMSSLLPSVTLKLSWALVNKVLHRRRLPRSATAGLRARCTLNLIWPCKTGLQSGFTIFDFHQLCTEDPIQPVNASLFYWHTAGFAVALMLMSIVSDTYCSLGYWLLPF